MKHCSFFLILVYQILGAHFNPHIYIHKHPFLRQLFNSFFIFRAAAKASTCRSSQPRAGDTGRGQRPQERQEARPSAPETVLHLCHVLHILALGGSDHSLPLTCLQWIIQSEQFSKSLLRQVARELLNLQEASPRVELNPRPEEGLQLRCANTDSQLQKLSPGASFRRKQKAEAARASSARLY